jgi:hypothetical protein
MLENTFNQGAKKDPSNREVEALCEALSACADETAKELLDEYGAAIVGKAKGSALISRAANSTFPKREILESLVSYGADINEKNEQGMTALMRCVGHWAEFSEDLKGKGNLDTPGVIGWLLEKGALIEEKDPSGWTAFMWAVWMRQYKAVDMLFDNGANVTVVSNEGETALDVAKRLGIDKETAHVEILFKKQGERLAREHAQWLEDTDFSRGVRRPIPVSGPLGPKA